MADVGDGPALHAQLQRIQALIEIGRADEALARLAPLAASHADVCDVHCLRAHAWLVRGDFRQADRAAERAVALAPDAEWPHRLRAIALVRVGWSRAALGHATTAVELSPHSHANHMVLADVLLAEGRASDALLSAARAVQLGPNEVDVQLTMARVHRRLGDRHQELAYLEAALRLDPHHPEALNNAGANALNRGAQVRGASTLARALRAAPADGIIQGNIDALGRMLAIAVMAFLVLGGWLAGGALFLAQSVAALDASWVRAACATAGFCAGAVYVWRALRPLTPAARRRAVRAPFAPGSSGLGVLLGIVAASVGLVGFAGRDLAEIGFGLTAYSSVIVGISVVRILARRQRRQSP